MDKPYFNKIRNVETGKLIDKLTDGRNDIALPPGDYNIEFAAKVLQRVSLKAGETFEFKPGRIEIKKEGSFSYPLLNEQGERIFKITSGTNDIPFPAGKYTLDVDGQKVPVTLKAGVRKVIKIQ